MFALFCYNLAMLDVAKSLPEDPDALRQFTALSLAEVKSQAVLIERLRHQLAGHRNHRFGSSSESIEQLQLALETSEISVARMTAKLRLPDEEPKDKPKRRPIPDHIPRMEVELTTGDGDCAQCGGALRRLGQDVTEELEYVPPSRSLQANRCRAAGRFIVNRIVRPRFACSGCEAFTQAALPSRPIERGAACAGRAGIFADDTPVKMLAPGTGKTATARLWAYGREERPWGSDAPPASWYQFSPDRKGQHPKDHLAKCQGWMHAPSRQIASQSPAGQGTATPGSKTSIAQVTSTRSPV